MKSTDAKRDLPAEALLLCRVIHQFDEGGLHILVAPARMASTLGVGAARHSRNVGVEERDVHSER